MLLKFSRILESSQTSLCGPSTVTSRQSFTGIELTSITVSTPYLYSRMFLNMQRWVIISINTCVDLDGQDRMRILSPANYCHLHSSSPSKLWISKRVCSLHRCLPALSLVLRSSLLRIRLLKETYRPRLLDRHCSSRQKFSNTNCYRVSHSTSSPNDRYLMQPW